MRAAGGQARPCPYRLSVERGLLLANLVFFTVTAGTTKEQFLAWGWRIPFLLSVVLVAVGFFVRARVAESPVFTELRRRRARRSAPLATLLRTHRRELVVAIGLFIANNMAGYILIAFITSYGTRTLGLASSTMLMIGSRPPCSPSGNAPLRTGKPSSSPRSDG